METGKFLIFNLHIIAAHDNNETSKACGSADCVNGDRLS